MNAVLIALARRYLKWRGVDDWYCSYPSGTLIHVLDPTPDMLDIRDINHALSHVNRFGGHTREPYSVGAHSLHVYRQVVRVVPDLKKVRRTALLHDAPEAYLNDVIRPLKNCLPIYRAIEALWWNCFVERWGLCQDMPPVVKQADDRALLSERVALCVPHTALRPWRQEAKQVDIEPHEVVELCCKPELVRNRFWAACDSEGIR